LKKTPKIFGFLQKIFLAAKYACPKSPDRRMGIEIGI
jgi:hypothetical protein